MKFSPPSSPPTYHPSQDVLTAYAAGTLRAGFDFVVAVHIRNCPVCAAEVREVETVGGVILSELHETDMSREAMTRTLARLSQPPNEAQPASIDELLASARKRWVAPRIWAARIDTPHAAEDRVFLLGAPAGVAPAHHGHLGAEFAQVLKGEFSDNGRVYRAGDFCEANAHEDHNPRVGTSGQCVCLFATQGRLTPRGILGRIAFRLAGI